MINNQKINIAIKMLIAGIVSFIVARALNIENYISAPAISILSIQLTRKDFIEIAVKRYISGFLSIVFSALLFHLLGINLLTFSLILIILLFVSWTLNASEGIVLSVVLISHFLSYNDVTWSFIGHEILLLTVAVLVAFIINMFYPNKSKDKIIANLRKVDQITSLYLKDIINYLNDKVEFDSKIHHQNFNILLNESTLIDKNLILENDQSYLNYLTMREVQIKILADINESVKTIKSHHEYTEKICRMLFALSENISFDNKALSLSDDLNDLKQFFIESPLPKSRSEFETRSTLLQILNDIERFLSIKIAFHNKYPNYNKGAI